MSDNNSDKLIRFEIDEMMVETPSSWNVLRAAIENEIEIPYYCWHPALSVVASCRLCLVEIDYRDPKSGEWKRNPKLIPSCQTPVSEDIRVWTKTEKVLQNRKAVMEFYLLNHPLDCPVCDKAGECLLQDYSYSHGSAVSRMIDAKTKQPKKDVGKNILLYSDRCVLCGRCVRFTREISRTGELAVMKRGHVSEIDVFSGQPIDNDLSLNVVDLCPVGSLLDKNFLFRERVWYLTPEKSVCSGCATGCTIWAERREERLGRIRPRYNPKVNEFWLCDIGRLLWKQAYREDRLIHYRFGDGAVKWTDVAPKLQQILSAFVKKIGRGKFGIVLSPMLDCEMIFMLASFIRRIDPEAWLIVGKQSQTDADKTFNNTFTISRSRTPNGRGLEMILEKFGGNQCSVDDLAEKNLTGLWITGGYFYEPLDDLIRCDQKPDLLIVHDSFKSGLSDLADIVLPMAVWVEREGTFVNGEGLIQTFDRAVIPPMGMIQDGQWLGKLAGYDGMYHAESVRADLVKLLGVFDGYDPPNLKSGYH